MIRFLRRGLFVSIFQGANIMSKYLRIRDDLIQKFCIPQNGIINVGKFLFIPETFQKLEVGKRQRI